LQNSPVDPYVCNEKSRLRKDFPELLNEIVLQAAVDSGWWVQHCLVDPSIGWWDRMGDPNPPRTHANNNENNDENKHVNDNNNNI